jgi:hypothetical protein
MNLRILKKLSKRAAPLLTALGCEMEQFKAEADDNYHGILIRARKHWERHSVHAGFEGFSSRGDVLFKTRKGRTMMMHPPSHPLKGTIMVGGMSGYYEPEWDEECAWAALCEQVYWHFTDYDEEKDDLKPTRRLRVPSEILQGARDMIADKQAQSGR